MDPTPVCSQGISRSSGGDHSESGFEAAPILPSQFFEGRKKDEALVPENGCCWLYSLMQCTAIRSDARRKRPLVFGHSGKPRSGYSAQRDMIRFYSRTCVTRLILRQTTCARWCVNGGSNGSAGLALRLSVELPANVSKQPEKRYINSACTYR
jgi:hypothetical protein